LKNIYSGLYRFENLYKAYLCARKNKRYRREVLEYSYNLEENLIQLQNELIWKIYKVGEYREFYVYEPKKRLVMALPFKDRILQWAIYNELYPFYSKKFITHTYACIKGRGTHKAINQLQKWLRQLNRKWGKFYCLKMDISKYFYRVDHDILIKILKKNIKDRELIELLEIIIRDSQTEFGMEIDYSKEIRINNKGMPIGNLLSQLFANVYLNHLDQYVKRNLGEKYYMRYMDDFLILNHDKLHLHELKNKIEKFLENELKLNLNNKTSIKPVDLGIEFLGHKIWWSHIKLKKQSALRMKRRIRKRVKLYNDGMIEFEDLNSTIQSYFGLMKNCDSYKLKESIIKNIKLKRRNKNG